VLQVVVIAELTVSQIVAGIERLLPDAAPVRPVSELRRGRSHASWVLDSGLGRLVGKKALGERHEVAVDRLAEHRRVWQHRVPVPRLLAFTESSDAVGDRLLIVSEYLPGKDAEEASRLVPANAMVEAMRSTGSALARLHQVPVDGFGDPVTGLGSGRATWGEVVAGRVEILRCAYRRLDDAPVAVLSAGLELLGMLADEVSPGVRPAVAHLDIYLPNVLLDEAGRFQVLLDLEHVRWVDPVMDFVKPAMWMLGGRPAWAEAFADGYRAAGGWPHRWNERLAVVTGLELLTGVEYWTRVGDRAMLDDYLRRLRTWVRSDGADHVWPSPTR
jgi:aminoglycoside phosphotransferase (APT) family kinase protein